jgi:hypothetical protein
MNTTLQRRYLVALLLGAAIVLVAPGLSRAMDPKFELDVKSLDQKATAPAAKAAVAPKAAPVARPPAAGSGEILYTVKPGDHLFKILMFEFGLGNRETEELIPEVKRLNGITDIRRLKVGSTLRIPRGGPSAPLPATAADPSAARPASPDKPVIQSFRMLKVADGGNLGPVRQLWPRLVPTSSLSPESVRMQGEKYSLSLDAERYPTLAANDGGTIVVDAGGTLPPLVRSLILGKDPKIRIIAENPANRRRFMASLLGAAKFYSVEENFVLTFGADPRLTVTSDFKIEKNPDSLLRQEVVLLNVGDGRRAMPAPLLTYLKGEGFEVLDLIPSSQEPSRAVRGELHQIAGREPAGIADGLLRALALRFERDRTVELFSPQEFGVNLNVKADRYFEDGGNRYVVSFFNGDPVSYTLTRLLETKGYKVILLDGGDDFRKVSEKLLTRLRVPGYYASHSLWTAADLPYQVQLSGVLLPDRRNQGRSLLLTNREINPLFRELVQTNGYTVVQN